ncbi:MAG: hypothetical protein MUE73_17970 [Planctomycetes bacterium]|jgi:hypothetical protein|nr:hypothetical protein [Planctomycetota bacterium]
MRSLIVILVLCAPLLAGPASWTAYEHGEAARAPADPGRYGGNAAKLCARTGPFVAYVNAFAITDPLSADQSGAGSGSTTNWYSLGFTGAADTTEHRWRITTRIYGPGNGYADGILDGTAWGECVLALEFSGDNENAACGQLAVDDSGGASVSLSVPAGFRVSLQKSARAKETDVYSVDSPKTTVGPGKVCRVRVSTSAEVRVAAQSVIGISSVYVTGVLHGDLTMTGTCRVGDDRVEDRFTVEPKIPDILESEFDPPTGGVEQGEPKPPDLPTDEEREGRQPAVFGPDDPIDAEDLPAPAGDDGPAGTVTPEAE